MTPAERRMAELVEAVQKHASANYDHDGWDYVIEAMSWNEIAAEIGNCYSERGAIRKVGKLVKLWDDHRKDIQATAW